jgi:hypothetical protein
MIHNTKEVARTFGCAAELAYNVSKEYAYLTVTPFTSALLKVNNKSAESVLNAVQSAESQIAPLKRIVNIEDGDDDYEDGDAESQVKM